MAWIFQRSHLYLKTWKWTFEFQELEEKMFYKLSYVMRRAKPKCCGERRWTDRQMLLDFITLSLQTAFVNLNLIFK